jgi:hypothetical protein
MRKSAVILGAAAGIGGLITLIFATRASGGGVGDTIVTGKVTDAISGEPISGAQVRITDYGVPPSGHYSIDETTTTNNDGDYCFSFDIDEIYVDPGHQTAVRLSSIAFGYGLSEVPAIIYKGENTVDIQLS